MEQLRETQEELLKTPISFKCGPKGCNVKPDPLEGDLKDVRNEFNMIVDSIKRMNEAMKKSNEANHENLKKLR